MSRGVLSEEYGHGGPGVCLGDGQTEAEGLPPQGGRGNALLRRIRLYLTSPVISLIQMFENKPVRGKFDHEGILIELQWLW